MKKFEIINNAWIKLIDSSVNSEYTVYIYRIIKIESIDRISTYTSVRNETYHITLGSYNIVNDSISYSKEEFEEYKRDLLFFENLIFS